ncbi:tetratricopeptide repeat protein [bacterium]|jgi:tetratricopeptide (TPR) repeat protein|nr:tetratricopeptide repeat protein [bacterium]
MSRKQLILLVVLAAVISLTGCRSAHVTSSILYIDQTLYTKAITVLHEGLEYTPDEAEAYFFLGEAHSKRSELAIRENDFLGAKNDYLMAYDYYAKASELDPSLADRAYESMLFNYIQRSNDAKNEYRGKYYEAAEGYFRLAYAAMPDSVAPIKNIARMKIKLAADDNDNPDLLNEALVLLDQVIEASPEAFLLKTDKATVLTRLGRTVEASALYDGLLADHPEDTDLLIDVARLSEEDQRFERAADMYMRVIDIYETSEDDMSEEIYPLALRAAAFLGDSSILRYQEAIDLYGKALRLELLPEENTMMQKLKLHYDYGRSLRREAEFADTPEIKAEQEQLAAEQFTAGTGVGNALVNSYLESAIGYYYLGMCYMELGNNTDSEKNLQIYRKLEGSN